MAKVRNKSASVSTGLSPGLRASQVARSRLVVAKLELVFVEIEQELKRSGGIYPQNHGRLSQAEVCRRAGIDPMTLYGENHKDSTKIKLDEWLAKVRGTAVQGKRRLRKEITGRADRWKANLDAIAHAYHLAELEMNELRARINDLQSKCDALEKENQFLKVEASDGRVLAMVGRKSRGV